MNQALGDRSSLQEEVCVVSNHSSGLWLLGDGLEEGWH